MRWRTFALAVSFGVLLSRWGTPLASTHAFREAQTAITVYWLMHGGPIWFPWTPVLGPPWTIPLEFPLFQYLVVPFAYVLPLDFAGRLVSWLFMVATLWPLSHVARHWQMDEDKVGGLYLLSPIMLYWGSCLLIETCAIFFGVMFLWLVLERQKSFAIILGSMAALVKGTSFVSFAIVSLEPLSVIPLVVGLAWQKWTDLQKPLSQLSGLINSTLPAQRVHNWGSLGDRIVTPHNIYYNIVLILGQAAMPAIIGLALAMRYQFPKRYWLLVAAFVGTPLIFPRLFLAHEYYWLEVTVPAVMLVCGMMEQTPDWVSNAFMWIFVIGGMMIFVNHFAFHLRDEQPQKPLADAIKSVTRPDDVVLLYGQAWSPLVPYYAQRRAIMEPDSLESVADMASHHWNPDVVVRCNTKYDGDPKYEAIFNQWPQTPKPPSSGCVIVNVHR